MNGKPSIFSMRAPFARSAELTTKPELSRRVDGGFFNGMELYVWDKEDFDRRYRREDWTWYRPLLSYCLRYGLPGPILDIGAGLGFFVECCRHWGIPCAGIDGSEYATELARAKGLDILHCVLTEETRLPFEDSTFSIVVMSQVLTHLHPPMARRVFAETYRVLQKQGVFIVTSVSRYFPGVRAEPGHLYFYSPRELRRQLEAAGFKIIADLNEPRPLLGESWLGRGVVKALYRILRWNILSESASFIARRNAIGALARP